MKPGLGCTNGRRSCTIRSAAAASRSRVAIVGARKRAERDLPCAQLTSTGLPVCTRSRAHPSAFASVGRSISKVSLSSHSRSRQRSCARSWSKATREFFRCRAISCRPC